MTGLTSWSARAIAGAVRTGKAKAEDVARAHLARIESENPRLNAFIRVLADSALEEAREVDARVAEGRDPGRLAGVPVALKDNLHARGVPTTCASKILEGYVAPFDATVVERLRLQGAVIVGKTNMDEFAMGSSTENSAFFPTRNPHDPERVPGGSSGGSAAAVAAGLVPLALGSDTGGSIRQPAAFCGVVGLKPTYGLVSRYGLVAFASSLDQIGPIARSVDDAALALGAIGGFDPLDSTSAPQSPREYAPDAARVRGLRVGLPREYAGEGLDPDVARALDSARRRLEERGAVVRDVSLPNTRHAVGTYYILAPSEASANLARFDGMRYGRSAARGDAKAGLLETYESTRGSGFGPEVKRRIMLGTYALSSGYYEAYYAKAQKVRTLIKRDFDRAFADVDVLLTPTAPTPAFRLGEKTDDPVRMYLSDVFTIPCNIAGLPGVSVPFGKTAAGLPLAVQLMARPFEEPLLLSAARALEDA